MKQRDLVRTALATLINEALLKYGLRKSNKKILDNDDIEDSKKYN